MRLGFSKFPGTLICGKICIYLLRIHYKKDQKRTYLLMIMRFFSDFLYKRICCGYSYELHWQVNAIQLSTHNICLYNLEEDKKYTGCNLKTTQLLDCVLIGVCAVTRSNTVCFHGEIRKKYIYLYILVVGGGVGGGWECLIWSYAFFLYNCVNKIILGFQPIRLLEFQLPHLPWILGHNSLPITCRKLVILDKVSKNCWMNGSVDPDQMLLSVVSDLV